MITGRFRRHVAIGTLLAQPGNGVTGTAKLESTCPLEVFAFAIQSTAQLGIEVRIIDDRRLNDFMPNQRQCLFDFFQLRR